MESSPSTLSLVKDVVDIISGVIVMLAAIIGGLWALRRYWIERTDEAAIELGVDYTCAPLGQEHLVVLDVTISNKGHTRIQAKFEKTPTGYAFDDTVEQLRHSGSLQFRSVSPSSPPGHLDWFEARHLLQPVSGVDEINLLTEYEDPTKGNQVDFWMEPGEVYHLEAAVVLSTGLYLAKVAFVGARGDDNFWSRLHFIQVPQPDPHVQQQAGMV